MRIVTILAFVICLPVYSNAQSSTFTKYIDFGVDNSFNVLELTDGYLTVMSAGHPIIPRNIYIVKTDFKGDTVWIKQYGNSLQYFSIYSLTRTYDGNFITGGYKYDDSLVVSIIYLMKFDINGDTLWTKEHFAPVTYHYNAHCIIETADHGFLVTGQIGDSAFSDGDLTILKTDSQGNFQWVRNYGGSNFDSGWSSVELPDRGFLTIGWSRSLSFGNRDLYLVKTDSFGNLKWQNHYGTSYLDGGTGITKTSDGNYLLAGYKGVPSSQEIRSWLIKVDTSGSILWQENYMNSDGEIWWARELSDGSIIAAGSVEGNTLDSASVFKVDSVGIMFWHRGFLSYNNHSCFRDVIPTTDKGFLCTGFVYDGPDGSQDAWLIKLDSMGCDSFGCPTVYSGVGLNELTNEAEFTVYPNPVKDILTIHFSYSLFSACNIKIYNMLGSEVYSSRTFIQRQTSVSVSDLPRGVYLLRLSYEGEMVTRKFIKN